MAEVSNHKEPIGRRCVEFSWFECQLMSDSSELRVKWFGCHLIWDSSDLVVIWFEIQMILVVNWFGIQVIWMSNELRFKWFGCRLMCDSNDFGQKWSLEAQKRSFSATLKLKNEAFLRDFLPKRNFEAQKQSFSARLPSKMTFWRSLKTKRTVLQKWHVDRTLAFRIPIFFSDFEVDASKVLRLPRKSWAKAYELL